MGSLFLVEEYIINILCELNDILSLSGHEKS